MSKNNHGGHKAPNKHAVMMGEQVAPQKPENLEEDGAPQEEKFVNPRDRMQTDEYGMPVKPIPNKVFEPIPEDQLDATILGKLKPMVADTVRLKAKVRGVSVQHIAVQLLNGWASGQIKI